MQTTTLYNHVEQKSISEGRHISHIDMQMDCKSKLLLLSMVSEEKHQNPIDPLVVITLLHNPVIFLLHGLSPCSTATV